jgi:integrase
MSHRLFVDRTKTLNEARYGAPVKLQVAPSVVPKSRWHSSQVSRARSRQRALYAEVTRHFGKRSRRGELRALRWANIDTITGPDGKPVATHVRITASKTGGKVRRPRTKARLRAFLEMRWLGPDGKPHRPEAFVFGNEVGEQVAGFKRAWEATILRAHGKAPHYDAAGKLTAESRDELRRIGFHFHDLRRESVSALLESGAPLTIVRDYLGHATVTMTNQYLAAGSAALDAALERREVSRKIPAQAPLPELADPTPVQQKGSVS